MGTENFLIDMGTQTRFMFLATLLLKNILHTVDSEFVVFDAIETIGAGSEEGSKTRGSLGTVGSVANHRLAP